MLAGLSGLFGMGLFLGGLSIDPHPVAVHEMREMADKHNQTLDLRAGAFFTPGGGGLLFSGRL